MAPAKAPARADDEWLAEKIEHLDELLEFETEIGRRFGLRREPLDKYHRCASHLLGRDPRAVRPRRPSRTL